MKYNKKIFCYYPMEFLGVAIITILVSLLSLILGLVIKFDYWWVMVIIFSICEIFAIIKTLYELQYLYVTDTQFVLKNAFGIVQALDINKCMLDRASLATYISWAGTDSKIWICIYDEKNYRFKFTKGFQNSRRYKRIQLKFSEENYNYLYNLILKSKIDYPN